MSAKVGLAQKVCVFLRLKQVVISLPDKRDALKLSEIVPILLSLMTVGRV